MIRSALKKSLNHFFLRKITIVRWQLNMALFVFLCIGIFFGLYFSISGIISKAFADSTWTQTDWSGGVSSGTVKSTVSTYSSKTNIDTSTSGQFMLDVKSTWSDSLNNWNYRSPITVTNNSSELTDFQVKVSVDTSSLILSSKMESDCKDLRFTKSDGTLLPYWIETGLHGCDTSSTYIWTKFDSLPNGSTDIYLYYGNSSATDAQNGDNVFEFFDDFNDGSIDGTKWSQGVIGSTSGTNFTESGGYLNGGNTNRYIQSTSTFTGNYTAETRVIDNSSAPNGFTSVGFWASTSNSWGTLIHNGTSYQRNNSSWPNFNTFSKQKWERDINTVIGTAGYASRTAEDGEQRTYSATNSGGISSEYLRLSTRYDSGTYNQNYDADWDWIFVRKAVSTDPTGGSLGTEETKYADSGNLVSNIYDGQYPTDWGTLTFTTSGLGTVTVKVRTDSNSDMSGATAWASCSGISSGTDLSSTSCVTDTDRYLQYQVTLAPSGVNTPIVQDITITHSASDQLPPTTNAYDVEISGYQVSDWTNSAIVSWTAGTDNTGGVGILGYCIAVDETTVGGVSSVLNPAVTAGLLNGHDDGVAITCTGDPDNPGYIVSGTSIDLSSYLTSDKKYYISLKAIDQAGNIYPDPDYSTYNEEWSDLLMFKYDATSPTNVSYISAPSTVFGSVNDMSFNWPVTGSGQAVDSQSGILGYQYQINSTSADGWKGTTTHPDLGIDYIPYLGGSTSSYELTEADDSSEIIEGTNTVFFRTVDITGNFSSASTYRTTPLEFGGDAPTFTTACALPTGVTVTPSTSVSNSFALSWEDATATGSNTVARYYYMVNTSPPTTLATLQGNSTLYIPVSEPGVVTRVLTGSVKGSNTVYVVAIDDQNNYSPSNCLKGTYTLNSTLPDPPRNLTAADSSIKANSIWKSSLTWDEPVYQGTADLTYIIERSTDNSSWTQVGTTAGLSYSDTTPESATYYYRVGVYDSTDDSENNPVYTSSVSVYPKGTYSEAPSLSGDPSVSSITTKRATVSWSTNRSSDSKVQYGTKSNEYFDEEPSKSEQVTSHTINLTNLRPGTKYYYRAKWTDEDGNTGISDEQTFTTDPAPTVSNLEVTNISIASAIVTFTTKNSSLATLQYGESTAYGGTNSIATSSEETNYTVQLTGLKDNTEYHLRLILEDSEEETYEFEDHTFATLPRPQIINVTIQQIRNTAQPSVLVSWNSNTEISSVVNYFPSSNPSAAKNVVDTQLKSGSHKMIITGLLATTPYSLIVSGRDKVGNEAVSETLSFSTSSDTRPPLISDIQVAGSITPWANGNNNDTTSAQLVINWNTDELATAQIEYGEGTGITYSQKTQEDSNLSYNHVVMVSGLTPSKVYHFRVVSKDSAGNVSQSIDNVTITPKATENALDLVITNLSEAFGFLGKIGK